MDQRHEQLTSLGDDLTDLLDQNTDYLDSQDRLDTMAADIQKLQSDTVRQGRFDAQARALQSQILEISLRLARTLDALSDDDGDDDPDRPPHRPGRTPTQGRSDRDQNQDRNKFRDHDGPILLDLVPEPARSFYNLLGHICHSI
jgi:hypothetical protein